jgi:GNAT superfamily N-acetyltransferase
MEPDLTAGIAGVPAHRPAEHEVRKATIDETHALARTRAQAFYDDPVFMWFLPDPSRRLVTSERGFELWLRRLWLDHNETYVGPEQAGVCIWDPPGKWKTGLWTQISLMPALARIFGRSLPRFLRAIATAEADHPTDPHYYLAFIGVQPERQRRGLGTALMKPILERCDAESIPAYLEATSHRNRALYQRHGFRVTQEYKLAPDAPPIWRMWRKPHIATPSYKS